MDHSTGTFSGLDDAGLFFQRWWPETDPRATLIVVHGYAEHSGRYQHVAEYFVERGYVVYALDHRGHGRSTGERADVGRFGDFVVDLQTFVGLIREQEPEAGIFMIGHSMGAVIATLFAAEHGELLQGLILSGAYVRARGAGPIAAGRKTSSDGGTEAGSDTVGGIDCITGSGRRGRLRLRSSQLPWPRAGTDGF